MDSENVNLPGWVIAMGLIIVLFIGLGIYLIFFKPPSTDGENDTHSSNIYTPNYQWSAESVFPGSSCQGYTFKTRIVQGQAYCTPTNPTTVTYLQMPSPTYNAQVLEGDTVDISPDPFSCVDVDQLNAIEVMRVCNQVVSGVTDPDSSKTWCPRDDGTYATFGESYSYYTQCVSDTNFGSASYNTPLYCPGSISGVSIGFQQNGFSDLPCLRYDSMNQEFYINPDCDLSSPDQQFRIIKTTDLSVHPGPYTVQGGSGNEGNYAAIVHRASGKCVMPTTNKPLINDGLALRDCSQNNDGFVWALIPPLSYPVDSQGNLSPNSKTFTTSPQQLVYIGAASNPDIKLNRSNSVALGEFLTDFTDNFTLSIYNNSGVAKLGQYKTCANSNGSCSGNSCNSVVSCNNMNYNSNYVSFILYNTLLASCTSLIS